MFDGNQCHQPRQATIVSAIVSHILKAILPYKEWIVNIQQANLDVLGYFFFFFSVKFNSTTWAHWVVELNQPFARK